MLRSFEIKPLFKRFVTTVTSPFFLQEGTCPNLRLDLVFFKENSKCPNIRLDLVFFTESQSVLTYYRLSFF